MLKQVFLHGVAVKTGDRAQAAGDGGPGAAAGFQVPGEALYVGAAGLEQWQVVLLAPAGVLAQVQGVRFAGQAGVTGQESSQGKLFRFGEHRLNSDDRCGCGRGRGGHGGTSRVGLRPGKTGPAVAPATMLHLTGKPTRVITQGHDSGPGQCSGSPNTSARQARWFVALDRTDCPFSCAATGDVVSAGGWTFAWVGKPRRPAADYQWLPRQPRSPGQVGDGCPHAGPAHFPHPGHPWPSQEWQSDVRGQVLQDLPQTGSRRHPPDQPGMTMQPLGTRPRDGFTGAGVPYMTETAAAFP